MYTRCWKECLHVLTCEEDTSNEVDVAKTTVWKQVDARELPSWAVNPEP